MINYTQDAYWRYSHHVSESDLDFNYEITMHSNREQDSYFPNYDVDESIFTIARESIGNWRKFGSNFAWSTARELDDPANWAIFYTENRDSRLLDQSNAAAIDKAMQPFLDAESEHVLPEHHNHWACGWIDGYSIRVYASNGTFTPEFVAMAALQVKMSDYPVLDEMDYSQREYDATIDNIKQVIHDVNWEHDMLPDSVDLESLASEVFTAIWHSDSNDLKSRDDQGGYPSEDSVYDALIGLGYTATAEDSE